MASAARFLDRLVESAPIEVEAIQVDGGPEFMREFESACHPRGIILAALPPKSPEMTGRVERMQATWRAEFHNVQDLATSVIELGPMIERKIEIAGGFRPHDALDGMTPDEYPENRRFSEGLESQLS